MLLKDLTVEHHFSSELAFYTIQIFAGPWRFLTWLLAVSQHKRILLIHMTCASLFYKHLKTMSMVVVSDFVLSSWSRSIARLCAKKECPCAARHTSSRNFGKFFRMWLSATALAFVLCSEPYKYSAIPWPCSSHTSTNILNSKDHIPRSDVCQNSS